MTALATTRADDGTLSDAALIEMSLTVPETFAVVFDRHAGEIHRYVAGRLGADAADDVTADTFLTAFRKRTTYDQDREEARPWLYGIATNLIGEYRRTERRRLRTLARTPAAERPESFEDTATDKITAERLRPRLASALARLSPAERDLLLLVAWTDLTYVGVAQALGIPPGTVASRLHRVRKKIRRAAGLDLAAGHLAP
ncbi:MAG: RNA polymerase sigma factor [Actinomycetota bacterium]|nr:RNA polymerase sigma factor [Actinomycetota bacterium]